MRRAVIISFIIVFIIVSFAGSLQASEIKIGVIFPFTGQMAAYGEEAKKTLIFAQDEVNASGGINGNVIKFIFEDSTGDPKGGVSAANKLISIDKVDTIIGCLFSSIVLAVKPIVHENEVVLVAPLSNHKDVFKDNRWIFSMTSMEIDETYLNAKYCRQQLGKKTLGTIYMLNDTGILSDSLISRWWEHFGGEVLINETFQPGSTDFRMQLTKIREANPDTVYVNGTWKEGVKILKQAHEMKLKTHFTTNSQLKVPQLLEMPTEAIEGITIPIPYGDVTDEGKKLVKDFKQGYFSRYKVEPGIVALPTYDCARAVFTAMKKGVTKGAALRDAISELDIPGVFGHIEFRSDGSCIKDVGMNVVKDGKFVDVNYVGRAPAEG